MANFVLNTVYNLFVSHLFKTISDDRLEQLEVTTCRLNQGCLVMRNITIPTAAICKRLQSQPDKLRERVYTKVVISIDV